MDGDGEVRHCQQCDHKVYDLSGMTREEAEVLVSNTETGMCVRFLRKDGMVMTRDCGQPVPETRKWGLALAAISLLAGCTNKPPTTEEIVEKQQLPTLKPVELHEASMDIATNDIVMGFISSRSPVAQAGIEIEPKPPKKTH